MGDPIAISIQNVSKKYRLFNSPKERLWETLHPFNKQYHREFWALRDIDFQIPKGATVGIIGRNGSGKSTLLQLICSVLKPTIGSIKVNGDISALLSLDAGLNPDFTGRDNVFFKGALMGISPSELKERMGDIEAFADIGEFFDQPLKIYSSGMRLRLAFAIAVNVNPEIMVIDEVIAVGDAKFQQKCFQKFREFQEAGKTILLTTHDSNTIVRHCDHALLLNKGSLIEAGKPSDVVNTYINLVLTDSVEERENTMEKPSFSSTPEEHESRSTPNPLSEFLEEVVEEERCLYRNSYNKNEYRMGDGRASIIDYLVVAGERFDPASVYSHDTVDFYLKVKYHQSVNQPAFGFAIKTVDGVLVYGNNSRFKHMEMDPAQPSEIRIFKISITLNLNAGDYFFDFGLGEKQGENGFPLDFRNGLVHLKVENRGRYDGLVHFETHLQEVCRKVPA